MPRHMMGWCGSGLMLTFLELAHMVGATWQPSSGGICLVVFVQNERAAELAWSTWQIGPKSQQCEKMMNKTTSFFRRMVPISTNSKQNAFVKTRTHGKNGAKWTYEPTDHKLKSTPLHHFVHLQENAMWISPRVAITAVTLFLGVCRPSKTTFFCGPKKPNEPGIRSMYICACLSWGWGKISEEDLYIYIYKYCRYNWYNYIYTLHIHYVSPPSQYASHHQD